MDKNIMWYMCIIIVYKGGCTDIFLALMFISVNNRNETSNVPTDIKNYIFCS